MKYYVNFNTGAGNYSIEMQLESLKDQVVSELSYTQCSVTIEDEDGNEIACLPWYGVEPDEEDIVTAQFGTFGFYGDWRLED